MGFTTLFAFKQSSECAEASEFKQNELEKRVFVLEYPANAPCEDRFNVYQFRKTKGYYVAVFDGHGGWQVSDYAMRNLHLYLDEELAKAKDTEDGIKKAILAAYDRVEQEWIATTRDAFSKGFPQTAYVGSCALVAVVRDNKLYVANAGDSKAALLRRLADGALEYRKASVTFNANKKSE